MDRQAGRIVIRCLALEHVPEAARPAMVKLLTEGERDALARRTPPAALPAAVAVRALAKHLLASETDTDPADWEIGRTEAGVPVARHADEAQAGFALSLSRTEGAVAVAVAQAAVGIDVERRNPALDGVAVARALFAPADLAAMQAAPDAADAFLAIWTLKEAVLKALGTGFALPPDHLAVLSLDPPRIGFAADGYQFASGWALWHARRDPFRVAAARVSGAEADIDACWTRVTSASALAFQLDDALQRNIGENWSE